MNKIDLGKLQYVLKYHPYILSLYHDPKAKGVLVAEVCPPGARGEYQLRLDLRYLTEEECLQELHQAAVGAFDELTVMPMRWLSDDEAEALEAVGDSRLVPAEDWYRGEDVSCLIPPNPYALADVDYGQDSWDDGDDLPF